MFREWYLCLNFRILIRKTDYKNGEYDKIIVVGM